MIIMIVIIIPLYNNYFWCVDIVFGNLCLFLVISTQINSSCPNNARDGRWGSCWLPTGQLEVTHAPHLQLHSWQSTGELTVNWGVLGQTWANCGQLGWTQANWGEDGKSSRSPYTFFTLCTSCVTMDVGIRIMVYGWCVMQRSIDFVFWMVCMHWMLT